MSNTAVDWVRIWEEIYDNRIRTCLKDYSVDHWTARAEDYSEFRRTDQYAYGTSVHDVLAAHGIVTPSSRVLEVGSGPGTFVIPFAKSVAHMTAVEPAKGMISVIQRDTAKAGLANYDIIPKIWQDVDTASLKGSYDLVITSTVIWMFRDILQQIGRMEETTGGHCCIVESAGGSQGFERSLWHSIMGDTPNPAYAGYPIIYNILYQNGRIPQVRMIDARTVRSFDMLMNVYRIFYSLYTEVTPEVEDKIRSALRAESRSGLHERSYRAAVVWWDPRERHEG